MLSALGNELSFALMRVAVYMANFVTAIVPMRVSGVTLPKGLATLLMPAPASFADLQALARFPSVCRSPALHQTGTYDYQ